MLNRINGHVATKLIALIVSMLFLFPATMAYGADTPGANGVSATISNTVWDDINGNGIKDADEPGIQGIEVKLTKDNNPATDVSGKVVSPTAANLQGVYTFANLPDGTYHVEVVVPQEMGASVDSSFDVTITNGQVVNQKNTGLFYVSYVRGGTWKDINGDGVREPDEESLGGVTINLLDATGKPAVDAAGKAVTVVSAADGGYELPVARPGSYKVEFKTPAGWDVVPTGVGDDRASDSDAPIAPIEVKSGSLVMHIDAGFKPIPAPVSTPAVSPAVSGSAPVPPTPMLDPVEPAGVQLESASVPTERLADTGSFLIVPMLIAIMIAGVGVALVLRRKAHMA